MSLTPAQIAMRRRNITASQAPTVMGENKYQTRERLMYMKTSGNFQTQTTEAQERGHKLEPMLIAEYQARHPQRKVVYADKFNEILAANARQHALRTEKDTMWSNSCQWMAATPDSIAFYEDWVKSGGVLTIPPVIVECKTSSSHDGWSRTRVPRAYEIQAQWQMMVMKSFCPEIEQVDFMALLASDFAEVTVKFDRPFAVEIYKACQEFHKQAEAYISQGFVTEEPKQKDSGQLPFSPAVLTESQRAMVSEYIRVKLELDSLKEKEELLEYNLANLFIDKEIVIEDGKRRFHVYARMRQGYIATQWKNFALELERLHNAQELRPQFQSRKTPEKPTLSIKKL